MTFSPDKHMQGLKNLIVYYKAYYYWQTDNHEIRKWEMRRARVSILCAAVCYKMAKKRSLYGKI